MSVRDLALDHDRARRGIIAAVIAGIRRLWEQVSPADIDRSWTAVRPQVVTTVAGGQLAAARASARYVPAILTESGIRPRPEGRVYASAFAGTASDGRPLDTLLDQAVIAAKVAIGAAVAPSRALATGYATLDMIAHTQVADAGRVADQVAITAEPSVGGYVRMLNLPACSRCVLLAGVWYEWNRGFERHPNCDCIHIPADEDDSDDLRTDPEAYFRSLTEAEQNRIFTKSGAQAIRDGADMGQVINARRGMNKATSGRLTRNEAGLFLTREGTTRRGFAGARLGAPRGGRAERLMPESIYELADGNRDEALRLLREHGYIL